MKIQGLAMATAQDQEVNDILNELSLKYQKYMFVEPEYRLLFAMAKITIGITQGNKMIELSKNNLKERVDWNIANNIEQEYSDL